MPDQARINLRTCAVVVLIGVVALLLGGYNLFKYYSKPNPVLSTEILFAGFLLFLLGMSMVYGGLFLMKEGMKKRKSPQT